MHLSAALLLVVFVLTSCTDTKERFARPYRTHEARVAAIVSKFESNLDKAFNPDTRAYFLTELQGMDAAAKLGSEGEDAARVWDEDIVHQYASRKSEIAKTLRQDIGRFDAAYIAEITPLVLPDSLNKSWKGQAQTPDGTPPKWAYHDAYLSARMVPICASLSSTPRAWASQYPARQPFTFERFGIAGAGLWTWCASIEQQKHRATSEQNASL